MGRIDTRKGYAGLREDLLCRRCNSMDRSHEYDNGEGEPDYRDEVCHLEKGEILRIGFYPTTFRRSGNESKHDP
jgi:hypothetical protein